jgi:hypothetical protein
MILISYSEVFRQNPPIFDCNGNSKMEIKLGQAPILQDVSIKFPVRLLGPWFAARNCISEPGPQEPYRGIFLNTLYTTLAKPHYVYSCQRFSSGNTLEDCSSPPSLKG